MNTAAVMQLLAIILGGGGLFGGIAVFFLMRANKDKIVVDTTQVAVVVLQSVINTLQEENTRLKAEHGGCEDRMREMRAQYEKRIAGIA